MIKQGQDVVDIVQQMMKMKPEERITADDIVKLLEKYGVQIFDEVEVAYFVTKFTEDYKVQKQKEEDQK